MGTQPISSQPLQKEASRPTVTPSTTSTRALQKVLQSSGADAGVEEKRSPQPLPGVPQHGGLLPTLHQEGFLGADPN